jgi:ABC-type sulfate transport system substrate-binding protein
MGTETSAMEKNAALQFEKYLLSAPVQTTAAARGFRPANAEVSIAGADSLFVKWEGQGASAKVAGTSRMRAPDRETLQALLRWFDLNVAK